MEITVPESLEALVRRKVDEGHYSSEDEVVADALRLMQARDEVAGLGHFVAFAQTTGPVGASPHEGPYPFR